MVCCAPRVLLWFCRVTSRVWPLPSSLPSSSYEGRRSALRMFEGLSILPFQSAHSLYLPLLVANSVVRAHEKRWVPSDLQTSRPQGSPPHAPFPLPTFFILHSIFKYTKGTKIVKPRTEQLTLYAPSISVGNRISQDDFSLNPATSPRPPCPSGTYLNLNDRKSAISLDLCHRSSSGVTPSPSAVSRGHKDHLAAFSFSISSTITFNSPSHHSPVFVGELIFVEPPARPASRNVESISASRMQEKADTVEHRLIMSASSKGNLFRNKRQK